MDGLVHSPAQLARVTLMVNGIVSVSLRKARQVNETNLDKRQSFQAVYINLSPSITSSGEKSYTHPEARCVAKSAFLAKAIKYLSRYEDLYLFLLSSFQHSFNDDYMVTIYYVRFQNAK